MYNNKQTPTSESKPFVSVQRLPVFDELYTQCPPVRIRLSNYQSYLVTDPVSGVRYIDLEIPIRYGGLLHPSRTMAQVEYCSVLTTDGDPLSVRLQLPELPSVNDFENQDYSKTVWEGITTKTDLTYGIFPPYSHSINTNTVGFPVRDPYLLNNRNLKLRFIVK